MNLKILTVGFLFASLAFSYSDVLVYRFDEVRNLPAINPDRGFTMNFDKYIYNGDIIEGMNLKSETNESSVFWLDTSIRIEEIKRIINENSDYKSLIKLFRTFSDNEISDKFEVKWRLLIKDQDNKYTPVILKVIFNGNSVDNYKVNDYEIFKGEILKVVN
jgi:hypothetical protein